MGNVPAAEGVGEMEAGQTIQNSSSSDSEVEDIPHEILAISSPDAGPRVTGAEDGENVRSGLPTWGHDLPRERVIADELSDTAGRVTSDISLPCGHDSPRERDIATRSSPGAQIVTSDAPPWDRDSTRGLDTTAAGPIHAGISLGSSSVVRATIREERAAGIIPSVDVATRATLRNDWTVDMASSLYIAGHLDAGPPPVVARYSVRHTALSRNSRYTPRSVAKSCRDVCAAGPPPSVALAVDGLRFRATVYLP
jgi:hypothetical protein